MLNAAAAAAAAAATSAAAATAAIAAASLLHNLTHYWFTSHLVSFSDKLHDP